MSDSIARTGLTLVGTVAGSFLGGPPGAAIGAAIGAGAGFFFFPAKGKTIAGRRLDDLTVSFSTYGRPIQILDGTLEVNGNYVWSDGLTEHEVTETQEAKGGPSVTTTSFLYTASWRINFCEGVAQSILKNWADNKVFTDITGDGPIIQFFGQSLTVLPGAIPVLAAIITDEFTIANQFGTVIRSYLGGETQLPGPAEQAHKGVDNTPAYRGQVGQEVENFEVTNYGNRIPNWTAEVAMLATDALPFRVITPLTTRNTVSY